jgi:ribosomal-protein-alanine N-acetyltransferase
MIAGVKLRKYREGDFDTLCEIDWKCFPQGIAYSPPEMRAFLKGAVALVAENHAGTAVAFLVARKNRVITVDVLPRYRRRGIARALMAECEKRLRAQGQRKILLETGVRNRPAQALYRALGYSKVKRLPHYYLNGEDGWLLVKRLDVHP